MQVNPTEVLSLHDDLTQSHDTKLNTYVTLIKQLRSKPMPMFHETLDLRQRARHHNIKARVDHLRTTRRRALTVVWDPGWPAKVRADHGLGSISASQTEREVTARSGRQPNMDEAPSWLVPAMVVPFGTNQRDHVSITTDNLNLCYPWCHRCAPFQTNRM